MAWAWLQSTSTNVASGNPTATYLSNVSAGTKLIAAVSLSSSNASGVGLSAVCTVADASSNTMTFIGGLVSGTTGYIGFFAMDTPAGDVGAKPAITATVNASVNNFGIALVIQEVSGLAVGNTLAAMIDGTAATAAGTSAGPATTGAYSSTAANEYLTALVADPGNGATYSNPPSGYTADTHNVTGTGNANVGIEYKNSTNGSESASFTLGASEPWITLLVAFKLGAAAAVGGGSVTRFAPGWHPGPGLPGLPGGTPFYVIPSAQAPPPPAAPSAPPPLARPSFPSRVAQRARLGRLGTCAAGIAIATGLAVPPPGTHRPPVPVSRQTPARARVGPHANACGGGRGAPVTPVTVLLTTAGSTPFVVPAGVTCLDSVENWGGGGGGGSGVSTTFGGNGG